MATIQGNWQAYVRDRLIINSNRIFNKEWKNIIDVVKVHIKLEDPIMKNNIEDESRWNLLDDNAVGIALRLWKRIKRCLAPSFIIKIFFWRCRRITFIVGKIFFEIVKHTYLTKNSTRIIDPSTIGMIWIQWIKMN